jgi:hypothetical protein
MENPALFVRVSTERGHVTVNAVAAERAGSRVRVLKAAALGKDGRPLPAKPRVDVEDTPPKARKRAARKRATKLRDDTAAATPTPTDPEASAEGSSAEE